MKGATVLTAHGRMLVSGCCLAASLSLGPFDTHAIAQAGDPLPSHNQPPAGGKILAVAASGLPPGMTAILYWQGVPVSEATVPGSGAVTFKVRLSTNTSGSRSVPVSGTAGQTVTYAITVSPAGNQGLRSPAATPSPAPQSQASPQPAVTVPSHGATSNGCRLTADSTFGEQFLFNLLNADRAGDGLAPLRLDAALSDEARAHSCDMFRHQHLDHMGSDGLSPFQRMSGAGVSYSSAGENIGMSDGFGLTNGIKTIDGEMMAEPSAYGDHRWNIVNSRYAAVGIGVIYAQNQVWLTEDFTG